MCAIGCNAILGNEDGKLLADASTSALTCAANQKSCGACVDTTDPKVGCGGECTVCPTPSNGQAGCQLENNVQTCDLGSCNPQFDNCNGDASDGCETHTTTKDNCGSCGASCGDKPFCEPVADGGVGLHVLGHVRQAEHGMHRRVGRRMRQPQYRQSKLRNVRKQLHGAKRLRHVRWRRLPNHVQRQHVLVRRRVRRAEQHTMRRELRHLCLGNALRQDHGRSQLRHVRHERRRRQHRRGLRERRHVLRRMLQRWAELLWRGLRERRRQRVRLQLRQVAATAPGCKTTTHACFCPLINSKLCRDNSMPVNDWCCADTDSCGAIAGQCIPPSVVHARMHASGALLLSERCHWRR